MGLSSCFGPKEVPYKTGGNVINVYFRAETEERQKSIRIHEVNTLRKAIQTYQEQINKANLNIKKAIYEPNSKELSLDTPLNELEDINFNNVIIVYLK